MAALAPRAAAPTDIANARKKLPHWTILEIAGGWLEARDPHYQVTGIAVHADSVDELVARVAALVSVVDVARAAFGGEPVDERHPGLRGLPAAKPLEVAPAPAPKPRVVPVLPASAPKVSKPAERFSPTDIGPAERLPSVIEQARAKGYEGDACGECGAMTMVRNGACLKCTSCGATNGCS